MGMQYKRLAIVTGASTGIGFELAKVCVAEGWDLVIAADEPEINDAAEELRRSGRNIEAVECDLATIEGNDRLLDAVRRVGRPVEALFANAGRGLGHGFLDQDFGGVRKVIDTNVTGTLYLLHKVGREMRERKSGRILVTGSIAGYAPGSFQAVYNATKAFLNSFSLALRDELKGTGVTVTVLEPGATETTFFDRAGMRDTKIGAAKKDDAAAVARAGFDALMRGDADYVYGLKNKAMTAAANLVPGETLAAQHRKMSAPGTAK